MKFLQSKRILILLAGALIAALMLPMLGRHNASAQAPAEDGWTAPVNLSNSGSSTDPLVVIDAKNITHVIWFDEFYGFRYTRFEEGVWSAPQTTTFPFTQYMPRLFMGPGNMVYAFWIDNRGMLNSSRVNPENIGRMGAWESRRMLTENTLAFDVSMDADMIMHLVYMTNVDATFKPAGIYYRQSVPSGVSWSLDKQIATSLYFRGMAPEQASLNVAGSDTLEGEIESQDIYVTWDEPALGKAMMRRSADNGETWEEAVEIDPDTAAAGTASTLDLNVTAWEDQTILIWKKQFDANTCEVVYQVSRTGLEWSEPAKVLKDITGCSTDSDFVMLRSDALVWQAVINNQVYLTAWDGERWSDPQVQKELNDFKDPVTGRALVMGCRSMFYQPEASMLHVVGCDLDGNQDIWYTRKTLTDFSSWFSKDALWTAPEQISSVGRGMNAVNLVSNEFGDQFSIWVQPSPSALDGNQFTHVMFAAWNGDFWSEAARTFRPRGGGAHELSVTINPRRELMTVWRGAEAGQVFFSRADAAQAFSQVAWSEAVALPVPEASCTSPAIFYGLDESIYVAYAVPANEDRGIYLNRSTDGGRTWSEPVRIFDGQASNWDLVDRPVVYQSRDGRLHAMWSRGSLLDAHAIGLGYARSDDNGKTWSNPDLSIEEEIYWADLGSTSAGQVLRAWQEVDDNVPVIVAQVSVDGGSSWQPPISIAVSGKILGKPDLIVDATGRVHLLQMVRDLSDKVVMHHWVWNNDAWTAGESLPINQTINDAASLISGTINAQGQLSVIYTAVDDETGNQTLQSVFGISSEAGTAPELEIMPTTEVLAPIPAATIAATPTATESPSATPEPEPTETQAATPLPNLSEGGAPPSGDPTITGLIFGVLIAGGIVVLIFAIRIIQARRREFGR